jgi:nicotinamidase-related amidase
MTGSVDGLMKRDQSQLLIVDIQEKLLPTIHAVNSMIERTRFLIEAARALHVPITLTEQYPKGLGPTETALREACGQHSLVFAKTSFSCLGDEAIATHLRRQAGRRQLVISGMEAHVCVLQTALHAKAEGYEVFVVGDAVSSRTAADREAARRRLKAAGVTLVSAEMVFFEWLERSGTPEFKALSPMLKG